MNDDLRIWSNPETRALAHFFEDDDSLHKSAVNYMSMLSKYDLETAVKELAENVKGMSASIFGHSRIFGSSLIVCALSRVDYDEIAETWLKEYRKRTV